MRGLRNSHQGGLDGRRRSGWPRRGQAADHPWDRHTRHLGISRRDVLHQRDAPRTAPSVCCRRTASWLPALSIACSGRPLIRTPLWQGGGDRRPAQARWAGAVQRKCDWVLHCEQVRNTITVRLPDELAEWLQSTAATTGVSQGTIIREQLEKARGREDRPFLRLAGRVAGPANLSSRKGFAKK